MFLLRKPRAYRLIPISEDFGFLPGWVAANGKDKATGPSILSSSGFIPDNYEVLVSTNALCSAQDTQGGCSVITPGAIAHRKSKTKPYTKHSTYTDRWLVR